MGDYRGSQSPKGEGDIDYRQYVFSKKEFMWALPPTAAVVITVAVLFFHSLSAAIFVSPLGFPIVLFLRGKLRDRRQILLKRQYIDGMDAYLSALKAGYSAENSLSEAARQLRHMYGTDCMMAAEFSQMHRRLALNSNIEGLFSDLAERLGIEEAVRMAGIFAVAKRNGGILITVLEDGLRSMRAGERLRRETEAVVSSKKTEFYIMALMPPAMLIYMDSTAPSYMSPLFEGLRGRMIMAVLLLIYVGVAAAGLRMIRRKI